MLKMMSAFYAIRLLPNIALMYNNSIFNIYFYLDGVGTRNTFLEKSGSNVFPQL